MVIVYRLSPFSYWLGRLLVRVPFIGLPNILAGQSVVKEFIQEEATADNIAGEVGRILDDVAYASRMREELGRIRELVGDRDGSVELARLAADMLGHAAPSQNPNPGAENNP
jgi:lipid-A-disaccharide synthase